MTAVWGPGSLVDMAICRISCVANHCGEVVFNKTGASQEGAPVAVSASVCAVRPVVAVPTSCLLGAQKRAFCRKITSSKAPADALSWRHRGRSSMVEPQPSKLVVRVRFPSPALHVRRLDHAMRMASRPAEERVVRGRCGPCPRPCPAKPPSSGVGAAVGAAFSLASVAVLGVALKLFSRQVVAPSNLVVQVGGGKNLILRRSVYPNKLPALDFDVGGQRVHLGIGDGVVLAQ